MAYLINLTHLQKSYGKQTVLHDINLNVMPKEIVGLIGPSGAGKSTTIKTMLGMEKVDSGETLVLDTQMPNRQILSQIGYMAQSDALYETLSAKENLQFFGKMKGVSGTELEQEIAYTANVVELTADLNKRVANYSGGMKRRLSLAIALLGQPELLVLDEPTVGIDPSLRRKIWHELKLIRDQGRSVLITTHVMDEAELTDRVALLLNGKIIAFAEPKKLEEQYQVDSIEDVFLKAESEEAAE
ncbi:ABC transporter ATP-binding protein [Lactobacillus panisapium]|uniref:ABC transporter ATP-binding protein n=1 Tax=Lactobacillus panisapium TaxID=2012495 RepID=UPI001C69F1C5|nr:ABC transporter ATP-binding protein [Lactobacillus panisapium]QYN56182.1 ABC transporter ATP-binding protein [Lactobacillus panisapium]